LPRRRERSPPRSLPKRLRLSSLSNLLMKRRNPSHALVTRLRISPRRERSPLRKPPKRLRLNLPRRRERSPPRSLPKRLRLSSLSNLLMKRRNPSHALVTRLRISPRRERSPLRKPPKRKRLSLPRRRERSPLRSRLRLRRFLPRRRQRKPLRSPKSSLSNLLMRRRNPNGTVNGTPNGRVRTSLSATPRPPL